MTRHQSYYRPGTVFTVKAWNTAGETTWLSTVTHERDAFATAAWVFGVKYGTRNVNVKID